MPQYLVHTPVEPQPLSEPDKRLSHIRLFAQTFGVLAKRIQIDSNPHAGPPYMPKGLQEAIPSIRLSLTSSVQPLEKYTPDQMHEEITSLRVVRYCIVIQMTFDSDPGSSQQFARRQKATVAANPVSKCRQ